MIDIDPWDPTPPSQQLAAILRGRIVDGALGPADQLPSETQLMQSTGLARETVRRAIRILREEGLVITLPGRGTFVPPE